MVFFSLLFVLYFGPVIFSSRLFPSDGILPSFLAPVELWTDSVWAGYPSAADPQSQSWYALSRVLQPLPYGWNAFVVSAYVLAASFTYGYVFALTGSRLAASIAGISFSMGGFMMAHLVHTTMIHAALWLPLTMWSLEALRSKPSIPWFVAAAVSIACSIFAGHPQVFVFTVALASAYAAFSGTAPAGGRIRYVATWLLALAAGCALAAVQLVPTLELTRLSLRAAMEFETFTSYSLPALQTIQLLFPYLFGGTAQWPYVQPYFGEWSLHELAGYAGILTLLLAAIGVCARGRERVGLFWLAAAVGALLLALGDGTALARVMYHVPVMNMFRVPARHALEMTFALSVLAGLGVHALQRAGAARARLAGAVIAAAAALMGAALAVVASRYEALRAHAAAKGVELVPIGDNAGIAVPVIVFSISAVALACWSRRPGSRFRQAALVAAAVIDVGSFGWFCEWRRYAAVGGDIAARPTVTTRYRDVLGGTGQRLVQLPGGAPDLARLHGVPGLNGYGPLQIRRFHELSGVTDTGSVPPASLSRDHRGIDLLAARYVLRWPAATFRAHGIGWSADDLAVDLGNGCGHEETETEFRLDEPVRATRLAIVSALGCSTAIPDGRAVVAISALAEDGIAEEVALRAGRDTSEWAIECSDVRSIAQHGRAPVFASRRVVTSGAGECQAHAYVTVQPLAGRPYTRLRMRWSGDAASIHVAKLSLIDDVRGVTRVVSPYEGLAATRRPLRPIEQVDGVAVYENAAALPRAWLVWEVLVAGPGEILKAIHTSVLPDGRRFEPRRTALVEAPLAVTVGDADPDATARVVRASAGRLEIETRARTAAFLVMSDVFYPGWRASVNGLGAEIVRTDHALQGLLLPPGANTVRVEFRPPSVYVGALVSGAAAVALAVLAVGARRRALPPRVPVQSRRAAPAGPGPAGEASPAGRASAGGGDAA